MVGFELHSKVGLMLDLEIEESTVMRLLIMEAGGLKLIEELSIRDKEIELVRPIEMRRIKNNRLSKVVIEADRLVSCGYLR